MTNTCTLFFLTLYFSTACKFLLNGEGSDSEKGTKCNCLNGINHTKR